MLPLYRVLPVALVGVAPYDIEEVFESKVQGGVKSPAAFFDDTFLVWYGDTVSVFVMHGMRPYPFCYSGYVLYVPVCQFPLTVTV